MCCWYIQEELDIEQFENNVLPLVVSRRVHINVTQYTSWVKKTLLVMSV